MTARTLVFVGVGLLAMIMAVFAAKAAGDATITHKVCMLAVVLLTFFIFFFRVFALWSFFSLAFCFFLIMTFSHIFLLSHIKFKK